nr:hypothetical protein [Tanacetum cinerariifolium]
MELVQGQGMEELIERMGSVSGGLDADSTYATSGLGLVIGLTIDIGTALVGLSGSYSIGVLAASSSGFFVVVTICIGSPSVAVEIETLSEGVEEDIPLNAHSISMTIPLIEEMLLFYWCFSCFIFRLLCCSDNLHWLPFSVRGSDLGVFNVGDSLMKAWKIDCLQTVGNFSVESRLKTLQLGEKLCQFGIVNKLNET